MQKLVVFLLIIIGSMLQSKVHQNVKLREHIENGHKFGPDQVLKDMMVQDVTPDMETFQYLISRTYQTLLHMVEVQGIKVNTDILGHEEWYNVKKPHDEYYTVYKEECHPFLKKETADTL